MGNIGTGNMFEVTGEEIMALEDKALRELVGRLCKAEVERDGIGTAGVQYSGEQDAPDGGADVEVDIGCLLRRRSYIPRACTYFQVKKPKMPPSAIRKEMCLNGKLRDIFGELASAGGCYIIASGKDNVSPPSRKSRIQAMKAVLGSLSEKVAVDFYDQNRLANWANEYEPVVAWVKGITGHSVEGWRPYGPWARADNGEVLPYIMDKKARVKRPHQPEPITVERAQKEICALLNAPGHSVRLIGLSGVGKTRFAQSLFEECSGAGRLSKEQALYVDCQKEPKVSPGEMLGCLIAKQHRRVMVVDNCPASEHHRLTEICSEGKSTVSLLTIEYDVQDDEPEDSEVYQIFPSSDECTIRILEQQSMGRSREDCRRIADLAGGNARIGIVLAKAAAKERDLNALNDRELFERIFWQNGQKNDVLHKAAEVCSLVYSFSVQRPVEGVDELGVLARLCGMDRMELYRNVNLLLKRQLVQERGFWRAVLPHALANRLAKEALKNIPVDTISHEVKHGSGRMLRSFSKRLSYLDDSEEARAVFSHWLEIPPMTAPNKWDQVCQYRLEDAVAVVPEKVLSYLEGLFKSKGGSCLLDGFQEQMLVDVLLHLAYEEKWFFRSMEILADIPLSQNSIQEAGKLFQVVHSRTMTPLAERLKFIRRMLHCAEGHYVAFGMVCLENGLHGRWRIWDYNRSRTFGMQQRDSGLMPSDQQEYKAWFGEVFSFIRQELISLSPKLQRKVKGILGDQLQGFWMEGHLDLLEMCCREFGGNGDWWQGWVSLEKIKRFAGKEQGETGSCADGQGRGEEQESKGKQEKEETLKGLISLTEPKGAVARIACILQVCSFDLEWCFPGKGQIIEECRLAASFFASHPGQLTELFLELDRDYLTEGENFGRCLAEADGDKGMFNQFAFLWAEVKGFLDKDLSVPAGYLGEKYRQDKERTLALLEDLEKTEYASQAVRLSALLCCSEEYLRHIVQLLSEGKIDLSCISGLRFSVADSIMKEEGRLTFLMEISAAEGGASAALDIFEDYCHMLERRKLLLSEEAKEVGRLLIIKEIRAYHLKENLKENRNVDYRLEGLIQRCFVQGEGSGDGCSACGRDSLGEGLGLYSRKHLRGQARDLFAAIKDSRVLREAFRHSYSHSLMLSAAKEYVEDFLDIMVGEGEPDHDLQRDIGDDYGMSVNVMDHLNPSRVLLWADSSERRFRVAKLCSGFHIHEGQGYQWTELAWKLMETEDGPGILSIFAKKIPPDSWSGSRSKIVRERLGLLQRLTSDARLGEAARKELEGLERELADMEGDERRMEQEREEWHRRFAY